MVLEPRSFKLSDILMDVNNPRFAGDAMGDQQRMIEYLSNSAGGQALLVSMNRKVHWINNIIVRKSKEQPGKYVVVEGNTRLACLKSGKVDGYGSDALIPVKEAVQEHGEDDHDYNQEIRVLQGIANVMVVKEWPAEAKGLHLYTMFQEQKQYFPGKLNQQIIVEISGPLGMTEDDVERSIKLYSIFNKVGVLSQRLEKDRWSYMEGIIKNKRTEEFFGFDRTKYQFEWEYATMTPTMQRKKQRMERLYDVIERCKNAKVSTPEFRKKFYKIFVDSGDDAKYFEFADGKITWKEAEFGRITRVNPPVNPPVNPVNPPVDSPVDLPVDLPVDSPVDLPVDPPADPPEDPTVPIRPNGQEDISWVGWHSRYTVVHEDKESFWPVAISDNGEFVFIYKKNKLYPSIQRAKDYEKIRVLLSIYASTGRNVPEDQFFSGLLEEFTKIWSQ